MITRPKLNQSLTQSKIFEYMQARLVARESISQEEQEDFDKTTFEDLHKMSSHLGLIENRIKNRKAAIELNKARKDHEDWRASVSQPIVCMSDKLVVSVHGLNLHEKRLMALAVSKIGLDFDSTKPIKVTEKEYEEIFNHSTDTKYAYRTLKQAACDIFERKIIWKDPEFQDDFELHRWVSSVKYKSRKKSSILHTDEGAHVLLHIPQPIVEHLQTIEDAQFVIYNLIEFAKLQTKYGQRLFENLKNFKRTGFWRVKIEDFCKVMEVPQSYLKTDGKPKDFGNINNRVIKPAIRDITKIFNVAVSPGRIGKAVTYLDFTFKKEEKDTKLSWNGIEGEVTARTRKIARQYKKREIIQEKLKRGNAKLDVDN